MAFGLFGEFLVGTAIIVRGSGAVSAGRVLAIGLANIRKEVLPTSLRTGPESGKPCD